MFREQRITLGWARRCFVEQEWRSLIVHLADLGMFQLYPLWALRELRIGINIFHGIDDRRSNAAGLKLLHDFTRSKIGCPLADGAIELIFIFLARRMTGEFLVRAPGGITPYITEALPLRFRVNAGHAPAIIAFAGGGSVRRGLRIAIGVAAG